jgi:hypothetical protein
MRRPWWRSSSSDRRAWRRAARWGRLSRAVAWFRSHGEPAAAVYPLLGVTLVLCWALGALVERLWSAPANRRLRARFRAARERDARHAKRHVAL